MHTNIGSNGKNTIVSEHGWNWVILEINIPIVNLDQVTINVVNQNLSNTPSHKNKNAVTYKTKHTLDSMLVINKNSVDRKTKENELRI